MGSTTGSIVGMKLSVSLPQEDVEFVDEYSARTGSASRSSVIHEAIALLRQASLQDAYAAAFDEWDGSDDTTLWDAAVADGTGNTADGTGDTADGPAGASR